jgi:hypothetical protein
VSDLASWADTAAYAFAPAIARFNATCQQWYLTTDSYGSVKIPLPNGTELQYELPNPMASEFVEPNGRLVIEVFDEGHIPHSSSPVRVYGACQ